MSACCMDLPFVATEIHVGRANLGPYERGSKGDPGRPSHLIRKIWSPAMRSHSGMLLHSPFQPRWYLVQGTVWSATVPVGMTSPMRSMHEVSLLVKEKGLFVQRWPTPRFFPSGPEDGPWSCTAAEGWISKHASARLALILDTQIKSFNLLDVIWKIPR